MRKLGAVVVSVCREYVHCYKISLPETGKLNGVESGFLSEQETKRKVSRASLGV